MLGRIKPAFGGSKSKTISKFKFSNVQNIISFVCGKYYRGRLREMQLNDILVVEDVVSLDVLSRIDAGAPHSCEFKFFS